MGCKTGWAEPDAQPSPAPTLPAPSTGATTQPPTQATPPTLLDTQPALPNNLSATAPVLQFPFGPVFRPDGAEFVFPDLPGFVRPLGDDTLDDGLPSPVPSLLMQPDEWSNLIRSLNKRLETTSVEKEPAVMPAPSKKVTLLNKVAPPRKVALPKKVTQPKKKAAPMPPSNSNNEDEPPSRL
ncbi:hypothetical protein DXG01_004112 [Tephrocybe rancida]|nr:hypothetical protein DXG01_004112 [Tephrocybe rancida]